jgi:glycolate oxidase FAD binding subunit
MSPTANLTREEALARLAAIAGPEHARADGEALRVTPGDAEQVAAVLRFANENGLSVVPLGGGSKLGWGNPVAPEVFLCLGRMNAVREHAWQDMTCTVEAGCRWAAMQRELARHGQMVALDPLWPECATVGGVLATNDSGGLRLRYGGLRDLVIGMTMVLADGTIAKSGGKVVKNVAGYDLHKLMTGSFGTLGVITEVNFRLHPLEQDARTFTVTAQYATQLAGPLAALLHAQIAPSAVQLRTAAGQCALDVRLCARRECLDNHAEKLHRIFNGLAVEDVDARVWQAREQLFAEGGAMVVKASSLPAEVCTVADAVKESAVAQSIDVSIVAQATGLMTVALAERKGAARDAAAGLIEKLRARLRPAGGSVVVAQMPDALRGKIDVWDCRSDALAMMREIKRRFDANRILSPGRFVGGI